MKDIQTQILNALSFVQPMYNRDLPIPDNTICKIKVLEYNLKDETMIILFEDNYYKLRIPLNTDIEKYNISEYLYLHLLKEINRYGSYSGKIIIFNEEELKKDYRMWNLLLRQKNFKELLEIEKLYIQLGHSDSVVSIDVSPDGKYMVSGSLDKTIRLWDVESGEELKTFNLYDEKISKLDNSVNDRIFSVKISKDGKNIILENNYIVELNIKSGCKKVDICPLNYLNEYLGYFQDSMCSDIVSEFSNNKYSAIKDSKEIIFLYSFNDKKVIQTFGKKVNIKSELQKESEVDWSYYMTPALVERARKEDEFSYFNDYSTNDREFYDRLIVITTNNKHLISSSSDTVISLWDIKSGKEIKKFLGHNDAINSIVITPNGKYIISGSDDDSIKLWDIESGKEIKRFKNIQRDKYNNEIEISSNGKHIFSIQNIYSSGEVFVKKIWHIKNKENIITYLSKFFSLDKYCQENKEELVSYSYQKKKEKEREELDKNKIMLMTILNKPHINIEYMAISDKYIASGEEGNCILLWDRESGELLKEFKKYYGNKNILSFSQNGKYLLFYTFNNLQVIWDVESGEALENFESWNNYEVNITISPNEKYLISLNRDSTIKIWEIGSKKTILSFISFDDKEWIVWTEDEYYDCSSGALKYISFLKSFDKEIGNVLNREDLIYIYRKKNNLFNMVLNSRGVNILC